MCVCVCVQQTGHTPRASFCDACLTENPPVITNHQVRTGRIRFQAPFDSCILFWRLFFFPFSFPGAHQSLAVMKWLASVRSVLAGGSRSAPVTPAASPNMPSKADLRSKQVSRAWNHNSDA